jgi:drug/metabolite transporter (DMT)-like permease
VIVSLLSAVVKTAYATIQKSFVVEFSALEMGWLTATWGSVLLLPLAAWSLLTHPISTASPVLLAMGVGGCVELGAMYAWLRAFQTEDLSVVSPLIQTTPLFVVVLEPLFLAVALDVGVFVGAVLTVIGAYVVLIEDAAVWSPLTKMDDAGPRLAVLTAVLFSIATVVSKVVLASVHPLVYATFLLVVLVIGFSVLIHRSETAVFPTPALGRPLVFVLGVVTALVSITTFTAFALSPSVSQVSIVFRASLLFDVLIGFLVFKEQHIVFRLLGGGLIILGIAVALL